MAIYLSRLVYSYHASILCGLEEPSENVIIIGTCILRERISVCIRTAGELINMGFKNISRVNIRWQ